MIRSFSIGFLAFLLGLVLSFYFNIGLNYIILAAVVGVVTFCIFHKFLPKIPGIFGLVLLIAVLATGYGELRENLAQSDDAIPTDATEITGTVNSYPYSTANSRVFLVKATEINGVSIDTPIKVRVLGNLYDNIHYGDTLKLTGKTLEFNPAANWGEYDYSKISDYAGTFSILKDGNVKVISTNNGNFLLANPYKVRHKFETALDYLPEEQSSLLKGIFFGDKHDLSFETKTTLSRSGIMHAFAVSGLHVSYLIIFLSLFLNVIFKKPWLKGACLGVLLLFYCAMVGFTPSVMRASIMALAVIAAENFGEQADRYSILSLAAFIILLITPTAFTEIGFQLSFIAMLGIIFFMPIFQKAIPRSFPCKDALLVTVSAQLATAPLIAYYFHLVTFISLLLNLFIGVFVAVIVCLCLVAAIFSLIASFLGAIFLYPAGLIAAIMAKIAETAVNIPFGYHYLSAYPLWQIIIVYVTLTAVPLLPVLKNRQVLRAALPLVLTIILLIPLPSPNKDKLEVTFLSVGEGNCVAIKTPDNTWGFIDIGGSSPETTARYKVMPFLAYNGVNSLDFIINTHDDSDHCGGIAAITENYPVNTVYLSPFADRKNIFNDEVPKNINFATLTQGSTITLGKDLNLEVLYPNFAQEISNNNDTSLVCRLTYKEISFLFTGDISNDAIAHLLAAYSGDISADILEIPHHGSENSCSKEFYKRVAPSLAIINVGKNSYGHPSKIVTDTLTKENIPVYTTVDNGAISIFSDGMTYNIKTFF